jgi:predicted nucleic acid-binding protein
MNQTSKVYLDTSVISHLFQYEKPEAQGYTLEFWKKIKNGEYEIFVSRVVFDEMKKAPKEKYDLMKYELDSIAHSDIPISDDVLDLSAEIISMKILPPKSINDSIHIAAALLGECDYLATWNMKHLANVKTNEGVRSLVVSEDFNPLLILTPNMFLGGII